MSYGKLEVALGPMYASKSTFLLKNILILRNLYQKNCLVFKPSFDNRYSEVEIVSHDGLKTTAHSVESIEQVKEICIKKIPDAIFFDEVQFFVEPHFSGDLVNFIKEILSLNVNIFAAGLDMDWKGNSFQISGMLAATADVVHKLKANCTVCGLPASKTLKLSQSGGSVELGSLNKYEARCNGHWSAPEL